MNKAPGAMNVLPPGRRELFSVPNPAPEPGRRDPLINALFEKLPDAGAGFPADHRAAWLKMMETTFVMVYGPAAGSARPVPKAAPREVTAAAKPAKPKGKPGKGKGAKAKAKPPAPFFFIDEQGFARQQNGDRILPEDVNDVIFDKRGENGDLAAITWADDSRGIPRGMQLDISTSV